MSVQSTPRRPAPIVIDHDPRADSPPSASGSRRREDDLDLLALPPARYDHVDRLYRNIVLVLFAIGLAVGFWFKT
jgi:hypothetical protein